MSKTELGGFNRFQVEGYYLLFRKDIPQPYLIILPNNENYWVAIFSTLEKLEKSADELEINDYCIKQITDGKDFIESIQESNVRIMLDPYRVYESNTTRWTEVRLRDEYPSRN